MEKQACSVCGKKSKKQCHLCGEATCKKCGHDIGKDYFTFLDPVPEDLAHGYYCHNCFTNKVSPTYDTYNEILNRAKDMDVYFKKKHSKEVHFFKKASSKITVTDRPDYDEMILNIAFLAAKGNYNTIINVETSSRKIHDGSYKIILWSGSGIPATKNMKF
jgi:hypothetical protein